MKMMHERLQPSIFYRLSTLLISIAFLVTGIGNLVPVQHIARGMSHLGYPPYFLNILGVWKIIAALVVLLPVPNKLKDFAYVGMMLDLTGAALSRLFVGDSLLQVAIPIIISVLVTFHFLTRNKFSSAGA